MAKCLSYAVERFLAFLAAALFSIVGVLGFIVVAPALESRLSPVLLGEHVSQVRRVGNFVSWEMMFRKERDCRLASADWTIQSEARQVAITVLNSAGRAVGTDTRGPGSIHIGPLWAVLPETHSRSVTIHAMFYYDCHPGWYVRHPVGPIQVPDEEGSG